MLQKFRWSRRSHGCNEGRSGATSPEKDISLRIPWVLEAPDSMPHLEQQAEVTDLLKYLSPVERRVIVSRYQLGQETRYGIEDIPVPYTEVARQLQMTRERVKTVEERALRKMHYWAERPHFLSE